MRGLFCKKTFKTCEAQNIGGTPKPSTHFFWIRKPSNNSFFFSKTPPPPAFGLRKCPGPHTSTRRCGKHAVLRPSFELGPFLRRQKSDPELQGFESHMPFFRGRQVAHQFTVDTSFVFSGGKKIYITLVGTQLTTVDEENSKTPRHRSVFLEIPSILWNNLKSP